jgi:CHRD domain-containing protein
MQRKMLTIAMLTAAAFALPVASANAEEFNATFSGFNEVGAILSEGTGHLTLDLNRATQTIKFQLTFSGLSAPVTQSHIHFGKVHTAGSVIVFFCSSLPTAPPGVQACPANGGTVTGTITSANVLAVAAQNVPAGDFDALTDALLSDTAYANVHTTSFPGGEIRGQIHRGEHDDN